MRCDARLPAANAMATSSRGSPKRWATVAAASAWATRWRPGVPLRTRRRGARAAKIVIKRMTAWYLTYLGDQVSDLGQAIVHLGEALAERVDGVREEVDDLRDRVARLEAQSRERGDGA